MQGEIYTLKNLEKMVTWRATFRHLVSLGSPPRMVCLMKKTKEVGYLWKMPERGYVEDANTDKLQEALDSGRLVFVKGTLPQGIKAPNVETPKKKKKAVA